MRKMKKYLLLLAIAALSSSCLKYHVYDNCGCQEKEENLASYSDSRLEEGISEPLALLQKALEIEYYLSQPEDLKDTGKFKDLKSSLSFYDFVDSVYVLKGIASFTTNGKGLSDENARWTARMEDNGDSIVFRRIRAGEWESSRMKSRIDYEEDSTVKNIVYKYITTFILANREAEPLAYKWDISISEGLFNDNGGYSATFSSGGLSCPAPDSNDTTYKASLNMEASYSGSFIMTTKLNGTAIDKLETVWTNGNASYFRN